MSSCYLNKDIITLNLSKNTIFILSSNDICKISDLWRLKRTDLKNMGLKANEINNVIIKLQLCGIDINKKIYNVN